MWCWANANRFGTRGVNVRGGIGELFGFDRATSHSNHLWKRAWSRRGDLLNWHHQHNGRNITPNHNNEETFNEPTTFNYLLMDRDEQHRRTSVSRTHSRVSDPMDIWLDSCYIINYDKLTVLTTIVDIPLPRHEFSLLCDEDLRRDIFPTTS